MLRVRKTIWKSPTAFKNPFSFVETICFWLLHSWTTSAQVSKKRKVDTNATRPLSVSWTNNWVAIGRGGCRCHVLRPTPGSSSHARSAQKENLYWNEIFSESPSVYQVGIYELSRRGFNIKALVIDGRRGVKEAFPDIPIQMCQFHQLRIITRYLTTRPKLEAGQELRAIALLLVAKTEAEFTRLLAGWYVKWNEFLKKKTIDVENGRWRYTHRRLQSAYFSFTRNLSYLFTYEKHPLLNIPKTTNCVEGVFSHVKIALRVHRGLVEKRKKKVIDFLLRPPE